MEMYPLDSVVACCRLAEGTRKAVEGWGLKLLCKEKRWNSDSLTVIETPEVDLTCNLPGLASLYQAALQPQSQQPLSCLCCTTFVWESV